MTSWIPFATEKQTPYVGIVSKAILVHYNNLEPTTYQNGTVSGETDFHVDISKSPRGE